MRRQLVRFAVLLPVAGVLNVAVAWGCALRHHEQRTYELRWGSELDRAWWYEHAPDGLPRDRPFHIRVFRSFGLSGTTFECGINTLFYAALLWLLFDGLLILHRFVRLQRGRCLGCGYPMGQSPVCTECGGALPKHAVA